MSTYSEHCDQCAERVAEAVALGKRQITEDMASGVVPFTVRTFSALHDYVDANTYAGLCATDEGALGVAQQDQQTFADEVIQTLHEWLVAGRPGEDLPQGASVETVLVGLPVSVQRVVFPGGQEQYVLTTHAEDLTSAVADEGASDAFVIAVRAWLAQRGTDFVTYGTS